MAIAPAKLRLPLLLGSIAFLTGCASASQLTPPPGSKPVTVKVKCNNNNKLDVSVDPFTVTLANGESVYWLPGRKWYGGVDKNDAAVTLVPKNGSPWPFATQPTMRTDRGVDSGPETANGPTRVSYSLRFTCTIDGQQRTIEVDPDIIISG